MEECGVLSWTQGENWRSPVELWPRLVSEEGVSPSLQDHISFPEIALHFSDEERALLSPRQRHLYESVMVENYGNVVFVGKEDPLLLH